jgi:hypothetical protein
MSVVVCVLAWAHIAKRVYYYICLSVGCGDGLCVYVAWCVSVACDALFAFIVCCVIFYCYMCMPARICMFV